jgi:hypothetical protein
MIGHVGFDRAHPAGDLPKDGKEHHYWSLVENFEADQLFSHRAKLV